MSAALPAGIEEAAALAGEHAALADTDGRLAPEVVAAVVRAGFARHFVPSRYGGTDGGFTEAVPGIVRVARACPSAGWLASLAVTLGRLAGYLPETGQKRIWSDPDNLVVGSLLPLGSGVSVDGGWVVEGRWPYLSSIEFAAWVMLLVKVAPDSTPRFVVVPRDQITVEPSWDSLGLRATGSHTVVAGGLFVPADMSFPRADMDLGQPSEPAAGRTHRVPLEAAAGLAFAPPVLGAAQAVVAAWTELASDTLATRVDRAHLDLALTRATWTLDCAALVLDRVARTVDSGQCAELDVARNVRDCALTAESLVRMADKLVLGSGTRVLQADHPLQRLWRDLRTGASHTMLQVPRAAAAYGRQAFGKEIP